MLIGLLATIFLCPALLRAQTPLDHAPAPSSPPTTTTFFPLSRIHRGEQGTAWTVFQGTKPEPMGVEILGLLHNAIGPGKDMIIARLEGAKPDYTGVVAGMSGSPVYIGGKLVGAISYRIGQFSKEPICGITPIAQMLEVHAPAATASTQQASDAASVGNLAQNTVSDGGVSWGADSFQQIDAPLAFSGFSPEAIALWKEHTHVPGLTAVTGLGGGSGSGGLGGMAPASVQHSIEPGSAVSAVLVRGDLEIAATCTVTYMTPTQLLACGHPITQFGSVSFPMTKAQVVATLPSPLNAFKIINTGAMIGSFTEDRQTAIRGQFGLAARMIPFTITISRAAAPPRVLRLQIVDEPQVTPSAVLVSVFQGLHESNAYAAETSYEVSGTVNLKGEPPLHIEDMVAPTSEATADLEAALVVGTRFIKLYGNATRLAPIESINIHVDALPGRRTAQIVGAMAGQPVVRGGDTVQIEATVQPWRGAVRQVSIPVTLPATLPPGPVRLLVSNGALVNALMHPATPGAPAQGLSATLTALNSLRPSNRLYVTLLEPTAQASVAGQTLTALPISMANAMDAERANRQLVLAGESAVPLGSVNVGAVLSGDQVVTLNIQN